MDCRVKSGNDEVRNERKKEAERRQTHCRQSRTSGCGRATESAACAALRLRARSPAGVPPRLLPRRVSHPQGAARAMLRGTWRATGLCPPSPAHFQRCTSRAGHSAGRLMPEPPECAADEATPAGTALAPLRPASPGRRPFRARFDSLACNRNSDQRQWNCDATFLPRESGEGGPSGAREASAGWWKGRRTQRCSCDENEVRSHTPLPPRYAWSSSPATAGEDKAPPSHFTQSPGGALTRRR
jgi:hypothetical protein